MIPSSLCDIRWLETILREAKEMKYTHFRIKPCGSFAGLEFRSADSSSIYSPSIEDMSITGDDCMRYLMNEIDMDEYLKIKEDAHEQFLKGEEGDD